MLQEIATKKYAVLMMAAEQSRAILASTRIGLTTREEHLERKTAQVVRIEGEIIINRPVEEVFDFVADERNEPRHNPQMIRAEQISDGPIGLGTRFRAEVISMEARLLQEEHHASVHGHGSYWQC